MSESSTPKSPVKTLWIASDHAGWEYKKALMAKFPQIDWKDLGTSSGESVDYPDFANQLCEKMESEHDEDKHTKATSPRGILICGSGQGMAMRANKYPNVRAALCWSEESCLLARQHNDANILCLGARLIPLDLGVQICNVFLNTEFEGGRHQRRVDKLSSDVKVHT